MDLMKWKLLLADDDADDCIFFREVLEDLGITNNLTIVNDGVEFMHLISQDSQCEFDILFLDLNMPRKTGFQCFSEIRNNKILKDLPVIIFSTSMDMEVVNSLYEMGAYYYIRKPGEFSKLKEVIHFTLSNVHPKERGQPAKENFVLQS